MPIWTDQWHRLLGIFVGTFLASYVVGFLVKGWLARRRSFDEPNERSSHTAPTLRGGGVGIMLVIGFAAAIVSRSSSAALICVVISAALGTAIVSYIDDRSSTVPWRTRISVHVLAATVAVVAIWLQCGRTSVWSSLTICPIMVFAIAGYANAFNFMDGINGLAAGQALITGIGSALTGVIAKLPPNHPAILLSLIVAGSAGGFLPHNFPKASMFMGDVGSVPLGFMLAVLIAWIACDAGWWLLVPCGMLQANFLLDTAITLVRRYLRGEPLYQGHRDHFYQRLLRAGWSHTRVTSAELGLQIVALAGLALAIPYGKAAVCMAGVAVGGLWLLFFLFCEMTFRRSRSEVGNVVLSPNAQ